MRLRKKIKRRVVLTVGGVIVVGIALIAAFAIREGRALRQELLVARSIVARAKPALEHADLRALDAVLAEIRPSIERARDDAHALPLRIVGRIPFAGRNSNAATALTDAVDLGFTAAEQVATGLRKFPTRQGRIRFGSLAGKIDALPWEAAAPSLDDAVTLADRALARARRAPATLIIGPLHDARAEVTRNLESLRNSIRALADTAHVLPLLTGSGGRRRYALVLQTPAEQRATGGLIGGFALIEADHGRMKLVRLAPNSELRTANRDVWMPAWFANRYDRFASRRLWANANMEPDFPLTGTLIKQLFQRTTGVRVDGIIAIDPVALSAIMSVTGPIRTKDGVTLDARDVARFVMSGVYRRYHSTPERKTALLDVAALVWQQLVNADDLSEVRRALANAVGGKHVLMWDSDHGAQVLLDRIGLAGSFRAPDDFAGVVTQNASGNKMDFYLRREIGLTIARSSDQWQFDLKLKLTNTGPASGLPKYVLGPPPEAPDLLPGVIRTFVSFYLPPQAAVLSVHVGAKPIQYESSSAPDASIVSFFVSVTPHTNSQIQISWTSDRSSGDDLAFTILKQATAFPDLLSVRAKDPAWTLQTGGSVVRKEGDDQVWQPSGDAAISFSLAR